MAERLVAALEGGQSAGGDKRGMQSAALIVVRPSTAHPEYAQRYVDLRVEDHKNPIAELRRVWQIHEGFHGAGAHLDFAAEYSAAGREDLARREKERVAETLERALKRNERDASLLNGLAWNCAIHGLHLESALRAAQRAALLEPRSADILDTLAEVWYRSGNSAQAIAVETRAATLDPKSTYLKDQIARFRAGGK
jgi:tetratricopeptide (TPR) repeat protein